MELQNLFGRKGLFPYTWTTPRPKQGPPTPPHLKIILMANIFKKNYLHG